MFTKYIITLIAITGLGFTGKLYAQVAAFGGLLLAQNITSDITSGFKKGLRAELYIMTGEPAFTEAPKASALRGTFIDGVPPFTGGAFTSQSALAQFDKSDFTGTKWQGFLLTKVRGSHSFRFIASGASKDANCFASVTIDGKTQKPIKFTQRETKVVNFQLDLTPGMTPLNLWVHCEGSHHDPLKIEEANINIALERKGPNERSLQELTAGDYYYK